MYISQSRVQQCEREPSGPPNGSQETRKLAGKNSTSRLCIGDSYVFAGRFSIYKSYFQCCLFIQYHPATVISHPNDLSIVLPSLLFYYVKQLFVYAYKIIIIIMFPMLMFKDIYVWFIQSFLFNF